MSDSSNVGSRLSDLIRNHVPFDAAEAASREQTLAWLAQTAEPLNRTIYEPGHATGSAFIVDESRSHVMLILHGKLHLWLQPGGHAEAGETDPLLVACRESREEVGLTLDAARGVFHDIDVHRVPARGNSPEHLHFDFRYLFTATKRPLTASSDVLEARWFTVDEAMKITADGGVRRMIRKLRTSSPAPGNPGEGWEGGSRD